jgi:hypothetical protein
VARDAIALSVGSAERRSHWENVYATKVEDEASMFRKTRPAGKAGLLCGHQKRVVDLHIGGARSKHRWEMTP